ncbi:MAG: glycosyltransferase, partial [Clostridia bacterium]|nr:glycosyltransferase [Clostridia bacterium]
YNVIHSIQGDDIMNLKVALLNDTFPPVIDGVSNAVINYANIIHKKHGQPTVIAPKYPNVTDRYPFEVIRYPSLNLTRTMPYRVGNVLAPSLLAELTKNEFDIIHNHCPFASGVVAANMSKYPLRRKTPLVFTYHTKFDIDIDRYIKNSQFNKIARRFVLSNINASDEVWTVSKGAKQSLRTLKYNGDIIVMPNGTDMPLGKADPEHINEIRRMYKLDESVPIFLYLGRMMWYKNIKIMLDMCKLLKEDGQPFKCIFVGDGPDKSSIVHYAKEIGLLERCIFTGAVYDREKVRAFFSIASLFLFPSTYDTSGLVVKEAAASYCPSLLVRNSCASDGVVDGFSGLLADENAESCAKAVAALLRQPDKLREMGINASKHIYRTWEQTVDESVKRYEYIIENFNRKNRKKSR